MKKGMLLFFSILLCFSLTACAEQKTPSVSEQSLQQEQSDIQNEIEISENPSTDSREPESREQKAKLVIDGQEFQITLYDTPAANALYDMLPLTLSFEDFNNTEKIAYMDQELPTEGEPDAFDPDVGDLCLYAPWGNLSIFYEDFGNASGLISLGQIDSGIDIIRNRNDTFSATLETIE